MLGFVIGTLCLIGLLRMLRRGHGGACGAGRWGGGACGGGERRARWGGERWGNEGEGLRYGWMRWVYQGLGTSPGQEKVIREAVEDLRKSTEGARGEWKQGRAAVAQALQGEEFDERAVQAAYARMEVEAQQVRDRFIENMRQVHATLDPSQRKRLAEMVARGGGFLGAGSDAKRGGQVR